MDNQSYLELLHERRVAARRSLYLSLHRGRAEHHKLNHLCIECRQPYNNHYSCPVHHTPLVRYVGHVPRKTQLKKWSKIK